MRALPHQRRRDRRTGRLIYREWLADDGTRRSKHCVQGRIQFGGKPDEPAADTHDDSKEDIAF